MIILGLGANLSGVDGTPEECLKRCVSKLAEHNIDIIKSSYIWKSAPVPISDQPWYRNAVCSVKTDYNPHQLLDVLLKIEADSGRVREKRNEARVLDLDILAYNNLDIDDPTIDLPHPRLHERAFVLYPLNDIAPEWCHPVSGLSVEEMIKVLPEEQEIKRTDVTLFDNDMIEKYD